MTTVGPRNKAQDSDFGQKRSLFRPCDQFEPPVMISRVSGHPVTNLRHLSCFPWFEPHASDIGKLPILLKDRPSLELIFVSSNSMVLLHLENKLLESVRKLVLPVKKS